jgi:D-lactate dehydrogenase
LNTDNPLSPEVVTELCAIFGQESVLTDPGDCLPYGYDNSRRQAMPQAVVFATKHDQVKSLVTLCNKQTINLVARGRGTGTTGATVPSMGGIVLSFERMNQILEIDTDNRLARVEPGVTNKELQDAAREYGFFWAPDPSSSAVCTVGGNLAYNSAGPRAIKYGTPRENTLGLRAITGTGDEIHTGVMTSKGVVGYDLTRLLIGSEGTLAIITEANLKLTPLPETKQTIRADYSDMHSAAKAVSSIMAQPVTPCALEFMDGSPIDFIRDFPGLQIGPEVGALLMIEVDGPKHCIDESTTAVASAARNQGVIQLQTAKSQDEIKQLWKARQSLSPALRKIAPKKINEDVVVPVSKIPELIEGLEKLSKKSGIMIVNFGHAGNGNIHVNLLTNQNDQEKIQQANNCLEKIFDLVLQLGGTLSGEHGVGLEKRDFISLEIDPVTLGLMSAIRRQFDPAGILNPGKVFPAD